MQRSWGLEQARINGFAAFESVPNVGSRILGPAFAWAQGLGAPGSLLPDPAGNKAKLWAHPPASRVSCQVPWHAKITTEQPNLVSGARYRHLLGSLCPFTGFINNTAFN